MGSQISDFILLMLEDGNMLLLVLKSTILPSLNLEQREEHRIRFSYKMDKSEPSQDDTNQPLICSYAKDLTTKMNKLHVMLKSSR
ncbi:hypothetical protein DEO72_LG9g2321 [Vigna unguiculata]|uniref:Uncharacterized protein n=1 Tax=Vigna unguiculata TaxID=3917 RepID=A0A4D6N2Z4_VIGUN|nr:hypothetical protein DEO72_LG9g2321 [Vigna unguiculata]